jgi:Flp pilus assembly protein RcpC/CpaB
MASKRSNNLLLVGAAVFALGSILAFFGLRAGNSASARPAAPRPTPPAGATGASGVTGPGVALKLPAGKQAVAVELAPVPGLAGYAGAGSLVNIYATVKSGPPAGVPGAPFAKLVLPAVRVLDAKAAAGSGNVTYVLALDVDQAERLIFFSKFESLWVALTSEGQSAVRSVGRGYPNAFRP